MVLDVDGTLFDSTGACRDRVRNAVSAMRAHGVPIAIATGRPLAMAEQTTRAINGADFAICGNGCTIYDYATNELVFDAVLPSGLARHIVTELRQQLPRVRFAVEMQRSLVAEAGFARRVPPAEHGLPIEDVLTAIDAAPHQIRTVIPFHDDYDDRVSDLAAMVSELVPDECEVQYFGLPICEVTRAGNNKRAALERLVEIMGINAGDVLAFGDGGNDRQMLQWAGTGVAMGNARPELQAVADHVTATNDEDGVAVFLEPILRTLEGSR